jgi:hypothetical protein
MPSPGEDFQSWSTTALNNGSADPIINWVEHQPRASVNNSARSMMAAEAKNRDLTNGTIVTTGTANAQAFISGVGYTSMPPHIIAKLEVGPSLTNTGAMTLNMDGCGAIQVVNEAGAALSGGEFVQNQLVDVLYNGTNWVYLFSVLNNVALTGNSTATTPANPLDNSNAIATTAWVENLIYGGQGIVLGQRVFKSAGVSSYVPTPGMKSCIVECVGGGGGGGGADSTGLNGFAQGGGGGSGGYSRKMLTATTVGASQTIHVGAGGTAGLPGTTSGGSGGDTFMGTAIGTALCAAKGGGGGQGAVLGPGGGVPGVGGTPTGAVGDITAQGSPGLPGYVDSTDIAAPLFFQSGSLGGSSFFGGGAYGGPEQSGVAAGNYGAGGSGGNAYSYNTPFNGGAGSSGICVITEFAGAGQVGPAGPIGPPGPQGAQGPQGIPGTGAGVTSINGQGGPTITFAAGSGIVITTPTTNNIQVAASQFTSAVAGDVPASGGGTINFLRADGIWSSPGPVGIGTINSQAGPNITLSAGAGLTVTNPTANEVRYNGALFTTSVQGDVPGSGGGTTNFLRADGTWAAPALGGGITVGSTTITGGVNGNFLYDNAGVFGERTPTQTTAVLDIFTSALKGVAPASGGGTSNFLRADGNWALPPTSGVASLNTLTGSLAITAGTGISVTPSGSNIQIATTGAGAGISTVTVQKFTTSGTYTPTSGMKYCTIECVGGGGGGGGCVGAAASNAMGGGGATGGYSRATSSAATVGASQVVTIGAGGTAGAAAAGTGGAGGATSVGTLVVANGGAGGIGSNASTGTPWGAGGQPAAAGTGDIAFAGNPGTSGFYAGVAAALGSAAGTSGFFGGGGSSAAVTGGGAKVGVAGAANTGAGGTGGSAGSAANAAGGAGGTGFVIITEYS